MKYEINSQYPYPDHTKIRLNPELVPIDGSSQKRWKPTKGELKLLAWLEEHISPIASYEYKVPFFAKEHWCIRECYSHDNNPEDWSWRNINYYKPRGELGIFLIIPDILDIKIVELMLTGLIQEAVPPSRWL